MVTRTFCGGEAHSKGIDINYGRLIVRACYDPDVKGPDSQYKCLLEASLKAQFSDVYWSPEDLCLYNNSKPSGIFLTRTEWTLTLNLLCREKYRYLR